MTTHEQLEYLRNLKAGVFTVAELHKIMLWQPHNLQPWEYEEYAEYIDRIYKKVKEDESLRNQSTPSA